MKQLRSQEKNPLELILEDEEKNELLKLINTLKPEFRDVIILRGIIQLSSDEVSLILHWRKPKVNLTYHRAIEALKKKFQGGKGGSKNEEFIQ